MGGIRTRRARARRRKFVAIAAVGAVVLAGATVTSLASWLDQEWVTAGVNGTSGIASSSFEVQQHVATDTVTPWHDRETGPGGVVDFGSLASSLSPGVSAVGYVSLRTTVGSVAGTLTLQPAPGNASSGTLGAALRYSAMVARHVGDLHRLDLRVGGGLAAGERPGADRRLRGHDVRSRRGHLDPRGRRPDGVLPRHPSVGGERQPAGSDRRSGAGTFDAVSD